jgi:hypothetical protein
MFQTIRDVLSKFFGSLPDDLVAMYAQESLPKCARLRINVLPLSKAIKVNRAMRGLPTFDRMGLFALDDANDSNPFCFVGKGPARGCILHLCHDGDTAVEYASPAALLQAMRMAIEQDLDIDDLPGKQTFIPGIDQPELASTIEQLLIEDSKDAEFEIPILTRLMDTSNSELISRLAEHDNFYYREAAAELIRARPTERLEPIAVTLAGDRVPQVAQPAEAALSAIHRMRGPH